MIEIKHLYKAFDNHMVLRNLNMKINDGCHLWFCWSKWSRQDNDDADYRRTAES